MDPADDIELMHQICAGRADLVGVLFDRHHRPVYGFFLNLTQNVALSEDLTQEVFLRILRYASTFRTGSSFRPWLYRIARNVLVDHRMRLRPLICLEEAGHLPDPQPGAQADAVAIADHEQLGRALAKLPLEKRELLLLSRDPDLSAQDLATLYGCTASALKVRVHRALNDLRAIFFQNQEVAP